MLISRRGGQRNFKLIFGLSLLLAVINSNTFFKLIVENFAFSPAFAAVDAANNVFFDETEIFGREIIAAKLKPEVKNRSAEDLLQKSVVQVCVVGEVCSPGQYDLSSPSSALSAVIAAGGPAKTGSYRIVKVFKGDFCQEFDLYDYFFSGQDKSPILTGGETVVLDSVKNRVKIVGRVERPGVYELKASSRNLSSLLDYAGGIVSSEAVRLDVFRIFSGKYKHIYSSELFGNEVLKSDIELFPLEDGDKVEVVSAKNSVEKVIELVGHFRHCGKISSNRAIRLSDVVAGENLKKGFSENYGEILRSKGESAEYEVIGFSVAGVLEGREDAGILLEDKDRIVVFSKETFSSLAKVAIEQGLRGKQVFSWRKNQRVSDLISLAGGIEKNSSMAAELIRKKIIAGRVESKSLIIDLSKIWSGDSRHDVFLEPFDLLLIRGMPSAD